MIECCRTAVGFVCRRTYLIHGVWFLGAHGESDVGIVGRAHFELHWATRHREELVLEVVLRRHIYNLFNGKYLLDMRFSGIKSALCSFLTTLTISIKNLRWIASAVVSHLYVILVWIRPYVKMKHRKLFEPCVHTEFRKRSKGLIQIYRFILLPNRVDRRPIS